MYDSIRFREGYPTRLAWLKDRTFVFPPTGLTILFGPNGSGKSTILKALGAHAFCDVKRGLPGWTVRDERAVDARMTFEQRRSLQGVVADVGWDGTPTYLSYGSPPADQRSFEAALESDDDSDLTNVLRQRSAPGSSGEEQIIWWNRMRDVLDRGAPTFDSTQSLSTSWGVRVHPATASDPVKKAFAEFHAAVRPASAGRPTILLDEPESHTSIPMQRKLMLRALPSLAETFQVIVATHSVFALASPGAHIVDVRPGYVDECRSELRSAFGDTPKGMHDAT